MKGRVAMILLSKRAGRVETGKAVMVKMAPDVAPTKRRVGGDVSGVIGRHEEE